VSTLAEVASASRREQAEAALVRMIAAIDRMKACHAAGDQLGEWRALEDADIAWDEIKGCSR